MKHDPLAGLRLCLLMKDCSLVGLRLLMKRGPLVGLRLERNVAPLVGMRLHILMKHGPSAGMGLK